MFATTLPLAASKTDWSEFLPEKLIPAIGDTFSGRNSDQSVFEAASGRVVANI